MRKTPFHFNLGSNQLQLKKVKKEAFKNSGFDKTWISQVLISGTRYVTLNLTYFCNAWLAIIHVRINGGWVWKC